MAHKPKSKAKKAKPTPPKIEDLDLDPDAWPKFEKLLKSAAKRGSKSPKSSGKD